MQLGTLVAVTTYFRGDLVAMAAALARDLRAHGASLRAYGSESRLAFAIAVGTVPVMAAGFGLRHLIEGGLTKSTALIIATLVLFALLLGLGERLARQTRGLADLTWIDALGIGTAQALALLPGASRSGTTLTAGLFLGLRRDAAARFSFLLSLPAVLASGAFELARIDASVFALGVGPLTLATVVSGVSGYAAIAWLLRYLRTRSVVVFVWYRLALGAGLAALLAGGVIVA